MKADNILTIVNKLEQLPYKSILFDGVWGIGKSYTLNEALADNPNVCRISMFGLQDAKQIYHEAFFQLALKNNKAGKIAEIADNVLDGISKFWNNLGQAKDVVQSITTERELFLLLANQFNVQHIIVIDDMERMNNNINFEEFLGIVEDLKQCNYVKIILVANLSDLGQDKKEILDKYSEKVIERTYHITEHAENIEWGKLNIHAAFIKNFLDMHNVKNLRTLEKAQRFYEDVLSYCEKYNNEDFKDELRLMSFAIVVESIENLYLQEVTPNSAEPNDVFQRIGNELNYRIRNYLYETKSGMNLVEMLLKYYQDGFFDENILAAGYTLFLKSGEKPDYYKSDSEIKLLLPALKKHMTECSSIFELTKTADSYVIWSDTIGETNDTILAEYQEMLNRFLKDAIRSGNENFLTSSYDLCHISSVKIKSIYKGETEKLKEYLIDTYLNHLNHTTSDKQAYEYSMKLRNYYHNVYYKDIIKAKIDSLYKRTSFPVDYVDATKYHTCYNIMYLLYHSDTDKFLAYCATLKQNCDHMSQHRIDTLLSEIMNE